MDVAKSCECRQPRRPQRPSGHVSSSGPNDAARLHREIVAALKLIGATYADLYRQVAKELLEPKAWRELPGYTPEDLEGEPPLPAANVLTFESDRQAFEGEDSDLEEIPA